MGKRKERIDHLELSMIFGTISLTPIGQSANLTAQWIVCIKVYVMGTVPITHK